MVFSLEYSKFEYLINFENLLFNELKENKDFIYYILKCFIFFEFAFYLEV